MHTSNTQDACAKPEVLVPVSRVTRNWHRYVQGVCVLVCAKALDVYTAVARHIGLLYYTLDIRPSSCTAQQFAIPFTT